MELIYGIENVFNRSFSLNSEKPSLFCTASDIKPRSSREFANAKIVDIYLSKDSRKEYVALYSYYVVMWKICDGVFEGSIVMQKIRCMHGGDKYGERDTNTLKQIFLMNGRTAPNGEPTEEEFEGLIISQDFNTTKICVYEPTESVTFVGYQNNHRYIMIPVPSLSQLTENENHFSFLGKAKRTLNAIFG